MGDKLDGATKKTVEDEIAKVREALKGTDIEAVKSSYETLQTKFQEISAELYKQAAASGAGAAPEGAEAAGGPTPEAKKDADVVDAEFEMVDEEKGKEKK
jgi:molecular chaperone DnaK